MVSLLPLRLTERAMTSILLTAVLISMTMVG